MKHKHIVMPDLENGKKIDNDTYYGVGSFLWEIIKVVLWALLIIVPIRVFLFQPFFVQGLSMFPNFKDGDYLIINELGYKTTHVGLFGADLFTVKPFKKINRDDVVVFRYPKNQTQFFIKRVVGLPGEEISIENNAVIVYNEQNPNGLVVDEGAYLRSTVVTQQQAMGSNFKLGPDEYFVMGDNRQKSSDSRAWGSVSGNLIMGKVLLRAWPISDFEIL